MFTTRDVLMAIQRRDPDGWSTRQPTDADRDAFRQWAIGLYGLPAWRTYMSGGWAG